MSDAEKVDWKCFRPFSHNTKQGNIKLNKKWKIQN